MNRTIVLLFIIAGGLLAGCLYPEDRLAKNGVPNDLQLKSVQDAVLAYQEQTNGLLPIKTRDMETPIFQKYPIDYRALKEQGILAEAPGNSFERGGPYQYVITTPDENPTVKVLDLRVTEAIRDLQIELITYRNEHQYPPFGERVQDQVFKIDYEELGLHHEPYVKSPYSDKNLPILITGDGVLTVDYRPELYELLTQGDEEVEEGQDLRYLLVDEYPIVPAHSTPFVEEEGEPVFAPSKQEAIETSS
ncbi:hypothetical protein N781_17880 [Pontibacillus halophilus JSM 076056 = DSM 19796]|uniref:ABC transporter periplasmic binding protein yphF n=1 Tax=Pontibacillus halophilus JSM 076056 = DSM 19796 TaxID=1385510 RepID=A0A0A5GLY8_9BACI|nr:hypothetical protein [Pontibacillus halophilus]KGX92170.1 hypothetical protein N781_17880 [Pontibacillus halophilus JSM 076056 = DSM 19796]